jgi:hypothetical protein
MDAFFKQVEKEDKQLCEGAQRNLNAGVYVNGSLHPGNEKVQPATCSQTIRLIADAAQGVLFFQGKVRDALLKHHEVEQTERREMWPAAANPKGSRAQREVDFCAGLGCDKEAGLEW